MRAGWSTTKVLLVWQEESASIPKTLEESEKIHIGKILEENEWNISRSAKALGIDRVTLYNKIKKYNIEK